MNKVDEVALLKRLKDLHAEISARRSKYVADAMYGEKIRILTERAKQAAKEAR